MFLFWFPSCDRSRCHGHYGYHGWSNVDAASSPCQGLPFKVTQKCLSWEGSLPFLSFSFDPNHCASFYIFSFFFLLLSMPVALSSHIPRTCIRNEKDKLTPVMNRLISLPCRIPMRILVSFQFICLRANKGTQTSTSWSQVGYQTFLSKKPPCRHV